MSEIIRTKIPRLECLDILRGIAIFGMVLVAIQPEGMPLWMYHAQVPPSGYNPAIPGLTWVDLIFPFFMFSLGASIPFALTRRMESGTPLYQITGHIFWRGLMMGIFSLYLAYWYPWGYGANPAEHKWIFWRALGGFFCIVMFLGRLPGLDGHKEKSRQIMSIIIKLMGLAGIIGLLLSYTHFDEAAKRWVPGFNGNEMDWVILRLAQSYIFASFVWLISRHQYRLRLAIIAVLTVLRIHIDSGGTLGEILKQYCASEVWSEKLLGWIPLYHQAPWSYFTLSFKWLIDPAVYSDIAIIALIGSLFGDILFDYYRENQGKVVIPAVSKSRLTGLFILFPALIVVGLYAFFTRQVNAGLYVSILLIVGVYGCLKGMAMSSFKKVLIELWGYGSVCLILGYLFDAAGHGIHKEPSNLSFYFATSGMAFAFLLWLFIFADGLQWGRYLSWMRDSGANPMMGYIAGRHFLFSIMHITGLAVLLETPIMSHTGLYYGYCFAVTLVAQYFVVWLTRKKIYLRV